MGDAAEMMPGPADLAPVLADGGLEKGVLGLRMSGVPLASIADAVGTPTYVYSADVIRRRYEMLSAALAPLQHRICFAVKANSNLAVLRTLRDCGAGADLVSGGELQRALAAGFAPESIVFSGVGKSRAELRLAVQHQVGHVNVESLEELHRLADVAAELGSTVRVGIRVNPDVTAETHPYISTGQGGIKFGVPADQVLAAVEFIVGHPILKLTALAMHLGSQLTDPAPYAEGIARLLKLVAEVRAAGARDLEAVDIGGGLGIRYAGDPGIDLDRWAAAVVTPLRPLGLTVYVEPGRFLVGNAGVLLTEVLYRKHSGGKDFVIVDAAMNDLLRPSLYRAWHGIVEVTPKGRTVRPVDVVGPICETGDFLALGRPLPGVEPGERLAILGAGAYGFVMSSNYNTRGRAAEVL
ncbi:MAG TPA: diaminopimelate decarboxylase, partial [Gemmatimonadales bacterium]|nr:diaminopimelate decarboxylase [Gemmatimonadales bacterium]